MIASALSPRELKIGHGHGQIGVDNTVSDHGVHPQRDLVSSHDLLTGHVQGLLAEVSNSL